MYLRCLVCDRVTRWSAYRGSVAPTKCSYCGKRVVPESKHHLSIRREIDFLEEKAVNLIKAQNYDPHLDVRLRKLRVKLEQALALAQEAKEVVV
jgi:hypothetical protein